VPPSFDEDILPAKDKVGLNGAGFLEDDIVSNATPDLSQRQDFREEESENEDQYTALDYTGDLEDPNGDVEGSSLLDDAWIQALETPSEPAVQTSSAERSKASRKNPRMQMFAYLSQPIVEVQVIGLVFLSCFLQAINTLDDLPSGVHRSIDAIDDICVFIFAVEFFLRWWSAGRFQLKYLGKPLAAIDAIVVILPLFLSGLLPVWDFGVMSGIFPYVSIPGWLLTSSGSALLNLRLLRILKFQRILTDSNTYMNFRMALGMRRADVRPYQLQLARVLVTIFTLVSVSTGLIYTAEHEVNPEIPDYFTALYFGLTTLTTVGFGDITPVTSQGRFVVGATILAGVAIIPAQAASLAEAYLDFQKERSIDKQIPVANANETKCRQCGASPHRNDAFFCWSCGAQLD